jgi:predicted alpha/beta superfamily hydrolase
MRAIVFVLCLLWVAVAGIPGEGEALTAQRLMLRSEVLDEYRPLNVVLPVEFDDDEFYPMVIVLDGEKKYLGEVAQRMHAAEPDLIIVGVENVSRTRDMFPDPLPERRNQGGGAAAFLSFILTELIPYIEQEYPVNGVRVLTGQSNSGFFVLYAMIERPYEFDAWIASSPMIGWDEDRILDGAAELFAARPDLEGALYMNRGADDYDRVSEACPEFEQLLADRAPPGFRWRSDFVEDGEHVPVEGYRAGIEFVFADE